MMCTDSLKKMVSVIVWMDSLKHEFLMYYTLVPMDFHLRKLTNWSGWGVWEWLCHMALTVLTRQTCLSVLHVSKITPLVFSEVLQNFSINNQSMLTPEINSWSEEVCSLFSSTKMSPPFCMSCFRSLLPMHNYI